MAKQYIKIRGASEHNLKHVSVDIPRDELVVLTGLCPPMPGCFWGRWKSRM